MSLDIGKHQWYHHHNQGNRHIQYHLPSFLVCLCFGIGLFCCLFLLWRESIVSGVVGRHSLAATQLDTHRAHHKAAFFLACSQTRSEGDRWLLGHSSPMSYSTNGILPSGTFHLIGQKFFRTSLQSENLLCNPPFFLFSSHSYKTCIIVWRVCLPFPEPYISSLSN